MTFHQPSVWLLALLLALPVIWRRRRTGRVALRFSSIGPLSLAGATWALRFRWIVPALRSAALALLIVCVARPQQPNQQDRSFAQGIAIQLVVDRSGSMRAMDFQDKRGRPLDRLAAVKQVVEDFVLGGDSLPGRPDDLIGMIAFARFADSRCPMTLDHPHLVDAIRTIGAVAERQEDGTAIGDAIALGVERLASLDRRTDLARGNAVKSKVIILLTDGENNAGDIEPLKAAEMAAALGIKVYTIAAGSRQSMAPVPVKDLFGNTFIQNVPVSVDEEGLRKLAEAGGGEYFRATDSDSLKNVYAKIDELEKTKIEQRRSMNFVEMAVEPTRFAGRQVPALLPIVLLLLALEIVLANTRFRTIP